MDYQMPILPYSNSELEPIISEETMNYHYGKHLQAYVNNINSLVQGTEFQGKSIEEIIETAPDGGIFNNAGQVLNHTLYFMAFSPHPSSKEPKGKLKEAIERDFGSFESFKKMMNDTSASIFGSGWGWLAQDKGKKLHIGKYFNGDNPRRYGMTPILCFDVWEHAYYLDYQNRRAEYLDKIWNLIDWDKVEKRMIKQ